MIKGYVAVSYSYVFKSENSSILPKGDKNYSLYLAYVTTKFLLLKNIGNGQEVFQPIGRHRLQAFSWKSL